ncbi:MAG: GPR endopeptidase [Clostridia bacterium]|nr:GPR endopeptidase [Clostridia bacterium]
MDFRTDMAIERRDIFRKANNTKDEIPGIQTKESNYKDNIHITKVIITNEQGALALGKPVGTYITIDIKNLKYATEESIEDVAINVSLNLKEILNKYVNKEDDILVVGLGNRASTPDSLGPKVVQDIDITRHLLKYIPQYIEEGSRPVSAISPGVLGTTGIETQEILQGIVENIKPKLVIVVDSLASKSIERISSSIQISDTGIVPGGGVANARRELSQNTLGIPVIAIGVPMVVEAATIASDSLDIFIKKMQQNAKSNEYLNSLENEDKYTIIKEALAEEKYDLIVTPKEIDDLIENMSSIVARGINKSL